MQNRPITREELAKRYPRIIRTARWAACLTSGEAVGALEAIKRGDNWAGEAVNHFGGAAKVLQQAAFCRHYVRRLGLAA